MEPFGTNTREQKRIAKCMLGDYVILYFYMHIGKAYFLFV